MNGTECTKGNRAVTKDHTEMKFVDSNVYKNKNASPSQKIYTTGDLILKKMNKRKNRCCS